MVTEQEARALRAVSSRRRLVSETTRDAVDLNLGAASSQRTGSVYRGLREVPQTSAPTPRAQSEASGESRERESGERRFRCKDKKQVRGEGAGPALAWGPGKGALLKILQLRLLVHHGLFRLKIVLCRRK